MADFTQAELQAIAVADELQISTRRMNGTPRPFVTIWHVRDGGDIYVRSANGPSAGWFRRAVTKGRGDIRSGGVLMRVIFDRNIDEATQERIDFAYHAKYDRYGPRMVSVVVGPAVRQVTLRVRPE